MLWQLYKAEKKKLKRSPVWIIFIVVPIVPAFMGTANYVNNLELLTSEWYSLWTQHTLFTSYFFLPIMLGVYGSFLMRMEKYNHNLTKLLTLPISRKELFAAKLMSAGRIIVLTELWVGVLFIISGKIIGMAAKPPVGELIVWCLFGALGAIVIEALQLIIALFCESFALPIGISFAGGLTGLVMISEKYGHIYPYSLMAYGMVANNRNQQLTAEGYPLFVIVCVCYIAVFAALGAYIMERKEV